ncbi:MAG: undecaprenyldiphospho-muramoylpentapeptide beta-N-acetylglucosaminyltransferase [Bacteroidales bacterium]
MNKNKKYIISGGGTGGHIFPAIAIASGLKAKDPNCEILFIGARGRMEMEKIPEAGYKIIGLNVSGLVRNSKIKNIPVLIKFGFGVLKAMSIIRKFKPDVAIGVGGYASGAMMKAASLKGVNILIQEQNSLPGKTNQMIANKAKKICVAYDGMEKYFEKEKIIKTGNPVRQDILETVKGSEEAYNKFEVGKDKKIILVVGGSQGALSINNAIYNNIELFDSLGAQFIWQTGNSFYEKAETIIKEKNIKNIKCYKFIYDMSSAYSISDLAISRAGALALSEFCIVGMPVILVPLPTAAENHQMINALSLSKEGAAVVIEDKDVNDKLFDVLQDLLNNSIKLNNMTENIKKLAIFDSVDRIVEEIEKLQTN